MSNPVYPCEACGSSVDPEFAQFQFARFTSPPAPTCGSCIEQLESYPQMQAAFEGIENALSEQNRQEWNEFDFDEKFMRFLYYRDQGHIRPGHYEYDTRDEQMLLGLAFEELIRLKCAKLQWEGYPNPNA